MAKNFDELGSNRTRDQEVNKSIDIKQSKDFLNVSFNIRPEIMNDLNEVHKRYDTTEHHIYKSQIFEYAISLVCREILSNPDSFHLQAIRNMPSPKRGPGKGQ